MKNVQKLALIIIIQIVSGCATSKLSYQKQESDILKVEQLTDNIFVHISYLNTESFGKVACNGMVFRSKGEAVIFDTPANDSASVELIKWVQNELKCKVKAVVINHFHADCLGGLEVFHKAGIVSYANQMTIDQINQTASAKTIIPKYGFNQTNEISVGGKKVINEYFGEGHSKDNIVSYIPSENALFGGCMIKEVKASKGYLGDANIQEWSKTVAKIKEKYPALKTIIPGHGKCGGVELLDYTIELFKNQ